MVWVIDGNEKMTTIVIWLYVHGDNPSIDQQTNNVEKDIAQHPVGSFWAFLADVLVWNGICLRVGIVDYVIIYSKYEGKYRT